VKRAGVEPLKKDNMFDNTDKSRRARHSRSSSPARRAPRDISRLAPSAASDPTVRQTDRLRQRSRRDVSPAARSRRRRRLTITIASLVGILALAAAGFTYAYVRSIGNKLNGAFNSDVALQQVLGGQKTPEPGKPFYMALMGSDTRPGQSQQRSDTLIVARVDPQKKKISMISIPRDSRVAIPGQWTTKINAAAVYGGTSLVIKTLKQLTGLPITHYVNLNFNGFRDVVDAIGGVWVDVPIEIYDTQASAYGKAYATVHKG
jgi:LCP family protein required for cell wall assembly